MFLNPGFVVLSLITSSCLFAISIVLYATRSHLHVDFTQEYDIAEDSPTFSELPVNLGGYFVPETSLIPPQSLTAILPILPGSLHRTEELIQPFLEPQEHVLELVIVCPDTIASSIRHVLQDTFSSLQSEGHPVISLHPWHDLHAPFASLKTAAAATTEWVLIMDDSGLSDQLEYDSHVLLHPPNISLPFGPHGQVLTASEVIYLSSWGESVAGKYVRPPFVMASSLSPFGREYDGPDVDCSSWAYFGEYVANLQLDPVGGILFKEAISTESSSLLIYPVDVDLLPDQLLVDWEGPLSNDTDITPILLSYPPLVNISEASSLPRFVLFLPTLKDIQRMHAFLCAMVATQKWRIQILIYGDVVRTPFQGEWITGTLETSRCTVRYDILSEQTPTMFGVSGSAPLFDWLGHQNVPVDVVLCLKEGKILVNYLCSPHRNSPLHLTTVIKIPRPDLDQMEWMSSLSLEEWKSTISEIRSNYNVLLINTVRLAYSSSRYHGYHQRPSSLIEAIA